MKHLLFITLLLGSLAPAQPAADPTVPDPVLQQLLSAASGPSTAEKLPAMSLRAKILTRSGQGLVIIESNKTLYTLKKDIPITLPLTTGAAPVTLRLTELSKDSVSIEVLPLKQIIRF